MSTPVLELRGIHKTFGATRALDGVSLSVGLGEFVALLGPNGAGKSTLIKILDGVHRPDAGTVEVRAGAGGMGVVHQDLGLVPTMSVAENLALGRKRRWRSPARDAAVARRSLALVGLERLDPHELV
jgi:ABC-type sugar transport system ATPase subunit